MVLLLLQPAARLALVGCAFWTRGTMSPYRTAAVKPPAITEKIMTHSTWGGGRFRMRWDHNSGFIEFGITENAMTEPEFWLRVDVEDAGRVYHALSQAIGMATPAPPVEPGAKR